MLFFMHLIRYQFSRKSSIERKAWRIRLKRLEQLEAFYKEGKQSAEELPGSEKNLQVVMNRTVSLQDLSKMERYRKTE